MKTLKRHHTYHFSSESFGSAYNYFRYFIEHSYEIGMHKQEFFEINIVTHGSGTHYIDGGAISANVGDVFIIPPELEHGYEGGEGFDVLHILINNRFMQKNLTELRAMSGFSLLFDVEPLMRAKAGRSLHLSLDPENFLDIMDTISDRLDKNGALCADEAILNTGAFFTLVSKLCRIYTKDITSGSVLGTGEDAAFMHAFSLIHERYKEKLSIDMLAREARLSRSSFTRKFKYICKTSPAQYITAKRVEAAENMLLMTAAPISDIAEETGFYDASHLTRAFFKIHGVTPSEYRKRNKSEND